jgi:hypothetical protein
MNWADGSLPFYFAGTDNVRFNLRQRRRRCSCWIILPAKQIKIPLAPFFKGGICKPISGFCVYFALRLWRRLKRTMCAMPVIG